MAPDGARRPRAERRRARGRRALPALRPPAQPTADAPTDRGRERAGPTLTPTPSPPQGLAEHKDELGAPLCPCRHYDDKAAEAEQGFWNCPCVPMRERKECHCMLFLTADNDFAGDDQEISLEEVIESTKGLSGTG